MALNFEHLDEHTCPACDTPEPKLFGVLGATVHLRCRACGLDFSKSAAEFFYDEEDAEA